MGIWIDVGLDPGPWTDGKMEGDFRAIRRLRPVQVCVIQWNMIRGSVRLVV